jgi:hypothetical protein
MEDLTPVLHVAERVVQVALVLPAREVLRDELLPRVGAGRRRGARDLLGQRPPSNSEIVLP